MVAAISLLTAFVQHFFLRCGGGGGATCGSRLDAAGPLGGAAATARPDTTDEWDAPGCQPPAINETSLGKHRCHLETDLCIDQGRFISWAPHRQPGAANYSRDAWRFDNAPTALPGHPDALQGPFEIHYCQPQPRFRPAALRQEQSDIGVPRFARCTLPVVFWPYWYMNVGEFLTDTLEPLWKMTAAGSDAPLLLDRGAKLTPVTDGFQLPDFYHWLLFPFSQRPAEELHELSARRHVAAPGRSRCFRRVMLCALYNNMSPPRGTSNEDYRAAMRPAAVGQAVVDFYRQRYPQRFKPHSAKDVLEILIIYRPHGSRRLLNMEQVLALCDAWAPGVGGFTSARCRPIEFQDGFLGDLAALQRAHIMVGLHGAPLIFGFLMRPGSALLEIRPHKFEGWWPNHYSQTTYNLEKVVRFFYLHTSDLNWQAGDWEKRGPGSPRDRNTIVDWTKLAKVLADAASGKPGYERTMTADEAPHYSENDDR